MSELISWSWLALEYCTCAKIETPRKQSTAKVALAYLYCSLLGVGAAESNGLAAFFTNSSDFELILLLLDAALDIFDFKAGDFDRIR